MLDNIEPAKKCERCLNHILPKEEFRTLRVVEHPGRESTIYIHSRCYSEKFLEQVNIKVNDTYI